MTGSPPQGYNFRRWAVAAAGALRFPPNLRDAFCIFWNGTGSTSVRRMQGGAPSPITIDPDYPQLRVWKLP